jgi:uncharacterized protein YggE
MKRSTKMFFLSSVAVATLLTSVYGVAHAQEPAISPTGTRLDVSAQSAIQASPDIATLQIGVVTKAATAEQARKENAQKMNTAFAILKEKNIDAKDYQTTGVNLSPDYVYEKEKAPRIAGYQAVNNLNVKLRDLDKVSDVIDALVAKGVNQINGPNFNVDKPETFLNKARQDAMKKADDRARVYAQATGLRVQRIVSISENANMAMPRPYMMKAAMAADTVSMESTPVAPGQIDLDVTVNVVYELNK